MLQQFEAAHSGQICIDQQAGLAAWMIGFEEGLARRKILDGAAVCLEHLAESVAYMTVVVDNKDDLPEIVGRFSGGDGLVGNALRIATPGGGVGRLGSAPSTAQAC